MTVLSELTGLTKSGVVATNRAVDMVVIGGGPAGLATAIALVQLGWSVTILERSHYESTRIGETFPPEIKRSLIALGVWQQFLADGPIESPGIVAAWSQPELYENDFIVNPYGHGWHVDRRRFDLMLVNSAITSGVEVLCGARQISVIPRSRTTWHINASAGDQRVNRPAPILVDATGRRASPIRHLTGPRIVHDRLVSLVGFTSAQSSITDRRTLIEAVEDGWWYCSPLPDGSHITAFMTDGDLLPPGDAARLAFWKDQLDQTDHTRARIREDTSARVLRILSACSSHSASIAGNNWLTVGDAATAFDPLSSQGVTWALETGLMAAAAIDRYLRGDQQALTAYASEVESEFAIYLKLRADYYGHEHRWPNSAFWQRRRHQ